MKTIHTGSNPIFQSSSCIDIDQLRAYMAQKTSHEQTHQIEAHLIDCELCSNLLEVLPELSDDTLSESSQSIFKKAGIIESGEGAKVIPFFARKKAIRRALSSIAATITLFVVVSFLLRSPSLDQIIAENASTHSPVDVRTGAPDTEQPPVIITYVPTTVAELIKLGKYNGALDILGNSQDEEAQLFRGECFLRMGDYAAAVEQYNLILIKYKDRHPGASLNLALAQIGLGKVKEGRYRLETIASDTSDDYRIQAKSILKKTRHLAK